MLRGRHLAICLLAACGGEGDPTWDDPQWTCVATVVDDAGSLELTSRMHAPGLPADLAQRHDGVLDATWTFAYDSERRLRVQDADLLTADRDPGTDGVPDQRRLITHTADGSTESFDDLHDDAAAQVQVISELDVNGWVRVASHPTTRIEYQVTADGWLDHVATSGFDPETFSDFVTADTYERDADNLLMRRITQDSRQGPTEFVVEYTHERAGGQHVIRSTGAFQIPTVHRYQRDADGRLTRAAVDEDGDGSEDWVVTLTWGAGGEVSITGAREGTTFRSYTYSAGCALELDGPWAPRGFGRPGPVWQLALPAIPSPY